MTRFRRAPGIRTRAAIASILLMTGSLGAALPARAAGDLLTRTMMLSTWPAPDQLESVLAATTDGTYVYAMDSARIVKIRLSTMTRVATYSGSRSRPVNGGDIAVAGGMLYIAQSDRIVRLSTRLDGTGWKTYGTYGRGRGQFEGARGIAVDGSMLYVLDATNKRVVRLSTKLDGSGWKTFGREGTGTGELAAPWSITAGGGYVFVGDYSVESENVNRIVRFGEALDGSGWKTYWKPGTGPGCVAFAFGLAYAGGSLYVADLLDSRVARLSAKLDGSGWASVGSLGPSGAHFGSPADVAVAGRTLVVADDGTMGNGESMLEFGYPRVTRLPLSLSATGWKTYMGRLPWVQPGHFGWPEGIATDGQYVYVADTLGNQIEKLRASDLSPVAQFGSIGRGVGQFDSPAGIAVSGTDLYVADTHNNRVVRLSAALDGSGWSSFGSPGTGAGQFMLPAGIAVSGTDLFVTDSANGRVVRLSAALDGSGWTAFGTVGPGTGQFRLPIGIAVDGSSLLVADQYNHRIVRLATTLDGSGWLAVGTRGLGDAGFYFPNSVAVASGHVIVADGMNERLKVLRASDLGLEWSTATEEYPNAVAASGSNVYVAIGMAMTAWTFDQKPATAH